MEKIITLFGNNIPKPENLAADIKKFTADCKLPLGYLNDIAELLTYHPKSKLNYSEKLSECQKAAVYLLYLLKQNYSNDNDLKTKAQIAGKYLCLCACHIPELITEHDIEDFLSYYEQAI